VGCYEGNVWRKWIPQDELYNLREVCNWSPIVGEKVGSVTVVDRIVPIPDRMEELIYLQKIIVEKAPHDIPPEIVAQITAGVGVIEETLEYLNSIGRKPWRPQPLTRNFQLEELVDILFYYLELIILSGFSWSEIVNEYRRKHEVNLKRYEDGAKGDFSWDDRATKEEL